MKSTAPIILIVLLLINVSRICIAGEEKLSGDKMMPYLGVGTKQVSETLCRQLKLPEGIGLVVEYVDPNGPSASALQEHDVLVAFDDQKLVSHEQLAVLVRNSEIGKEVNLTLFRAGEEISVKVKLGKKVYSPLQYSKRENDPFDFFPSFGDKEKWADSNWKEVFEKFKKHFEGMGTSNFFENAAKRFSQRIEEFLASTNKSITIQEESSKTGTYTLMDGGYMGTLFVGADGKRFKVTDSDGKIIYDGKVDDKEQINSLPPEARKLYDKIINSKALFSRETQI